MVLLSALVAVICSVDRAAISVTILPMSAEFLWDDSTKGLISSAFFIGYTVSNLCGGYLATKYPPGIVLASGVAIWSLFTIATPYAAADSLGLLLLCRVVMGLGEGVTFPCIQNLIAADVPGENKSQSLSFIYSGVQVGTIVSLLVAPLIIKSFSWEYVFLMFGAVGFVWLAGWAPQRLRAQQAANARFAANRALELPPVTGESLRGRLAHSREDVGSNEQAVVPGTSGALEAAKARREEMLATMPWREVLRNKPFWAILVAHTGWGFGHTICYAWLPNFYYTTYGISVRDSAWLSALPWIAGVIVTNCAGYFSDEVVRKGAMERVTARKLLQGLGCFGPGLCLMYLAASVSGNVPELSLPAAVSLVTLTLAMGGLCSAGYASNHQDLTTKYTGILFGITNSANSFAGTLSTYATGQILYATQSWASVFILIATVYSASAGVYLLWASSDNQFDNLDSNSAGNSALAIPKGPWR